MTDQFNPHQDFPDNYTAYHAFGVHLSQSADPDQRRHGLFIRDVLSHFAAWLTELKPKTDPQDLLLTATQGMAGMVRVLNLNYQLSKSDEEQFLIDAMIAILVYYHKNADKPSEAARRTAVAIEQALRKTRA